MNHILKPIDIGFIHIPKTAGTSIKQWIKLIVKQKKLEYNKTRLDQHRQLNEPGYLESIGITDSFAVVRNPWDRVVSIYTHLMTYRQDPTEGNYLYNSLKDLPVDCTFDYFVNNFQKISIPYTTSGITWATPQVQWLVGGIHRILRFENINEDIKFLQEKLNTDIPLLHRNRIEQSTERIDFHSYYTPQTQQRVAELFANDISRFGYKFTDLDPYR